MSESVPNYVTCRCKHCDGGIEFDANELTAENSIFPCPHCGLQAQLSIPKQEAKPAEIPTEEVSALRLQQGATVSLKSPRMTLTKTQGASPTGQALINLLVEIGNDGIVTEEEVHRLQRWLMENVESDIPAVGFLLRLSQQVLLDSKVTQDEAIEIQVAIERVLPKDIRREITKKRWEASRHLPASEAKRKLLENMRPGAPAVFQTPHRRQRSIIRKS